MFKGAKFTGEATFVGAEFAGHPVVLSGAATEAVHITDLHTGESKPLIGKPLNRYGAPEGVGAVTTVNEPDRTILVAGMSDGAIRTWDPATRSPYAEPWQAHTEDISAIGTATGTARPVILSGGYDGTVRTWDVTGKHYHTIELGIPVTDFAVTPTGECVVTTSRGLLMLDQRDVTAEH